MSSWKCPQCGHVNSVGGIEAGPGSFRNAVERATTCGACGAKWQGPGIPASPDAGETAPALLDPNFTAGERLDYSVNWAVVIAAAGGWLVSGKAWWGPLLGWAAAMALACVLIGSKGLESGLSTRFGGATAVVFCASGYLMAGSWLGLVGGGAVAAVGGFLVEGVQDRRRRQRRAEKPRAENGQAASQGAVVCSRCQARIQPATAARTGGLCMPCHGR